LLISIRGHVGRLAVVPPQLDGANITQDTARLALRAENSPYFIKGMLETESFKDVMRRYTKGAAVQGINLGDLKKLDIPTPPSHLQKSFEVVAKNLHCSRDAFDSQLLNLEKLFASLQHQAFNGTLTAGALEREVLKLEEVQAVLF
jgi:type I restriction enzyme, S subunit